jgi:dephospho-CoA kinase
MKIIGLTGGIGMGKSTAANFFRRARIPVFDADATVHALQAPGGRAIAPIGAMFPGTVKDRTLDRQALRAAVLGRPDLLRALEGIVHPLVRDEERLFVQRARRAGRSVAVMDIPLLLEIDGIRRIDLVLAVSAPRSVQVHRVGLRRRMDRAQIEAVIARQMPDREKRRRADAVVTTGLSRFHATAQLRRLLAELRVGARVARPHVRRIRQMRAIDCTIPGRAWLGRTRLKGVGR